MPAAMCWSESADRPKGRCRERGVAAVDRVGSEAEHEREHPARRAGRRPVRDPLPVAQLGPSARATGMRPEEERRPEEEPVLEIVDEAVTQRQVVERGHVPARSTPLKRAKAGSGWASHSKARRTGESVGPARTVRASGRRARSGSGRDRRGQGRPISRSGGATIVMQHVLNHVHEEQTVGIRVDRRVDRDHESEQAAVEGCSAPPLGRRRRRGARAPAEKVEDRRHGDRRERPLKRPARRAQRERHRYSR